MQAPETGDGNDAPGTEAATPEAAAPEAGGGQAATFRCGRCRRPLGVCWPDRLDVGMARFRRSVTVECLGCGGQNKWHPARPRGQ
jgi:hypothetical protein